MDADDVEAVGAGGSEAELEGRRGATAGKRNCFDDVGSAGGHESLPLARPFTAAPKSMFETSKPIESGLGTGRGNRSPGMKLDGSRMLLPGFGPSAGGRAKAPFFAGDGPCAGEEKVGDGAECLPGLRGVVARTKLGTGDEWRVEWVLEKSGALARSGGLEDDEEVEATDRRRSLLKLNEAETSGEGKLGMAGFGERSPVGPAPAVAALAKKGLLGPPPRFWNRGGGESRGVVDLGEPTEAFALTGWVTPPTPSPAFKAVGWCVIAPAGDELPPVPDSVAFARPSDMPAGSAPPCPLAYPPAEVPEAALPHLGPKRSFAGEPWLGVPRGVRMWRPGLVATEVDAGARDDEPK